MSVFFPIISLYGASTPGPSTSAVPCLPSSQSTTTSFNPLVNWSACAIAWSSPPLPLMLHSKNNAFLSKLKGAYSLRRLAFDQVGTTRDTSTVDATTNRINSLLFKVRSLRMSGSCALNLCGIACGRLDIFYELGFGGPWDVAAGVVIVQEAGGLVFDPFGGDADIMSRRMAASNGHLKERFLVALREAEETHQS